MLFSIFLALTIFGGAVTLLDLLAGGGHGDHNGDGDGDGDGISDQADGGFQGHLGSTLSHSGPSGGPDTEVMNSDQSHFDGSMRVKDRAAGSGLYRVVSLLRRSVYFSLGAGAAGLAALVTGSGEIGAFLWAGGTGLASLGILSLVRRLQYDELDSTVSEEELLFETGEVVVSILPGQIGKIRMKGKGSMIERYAQALDPTISLKPGALVKVCEVKEDMLIVVPPDAESGE